MLRNYIRTAIRNLLKNKTYSFLNIFGLAIGIACAGLIFLWVEDEVNFDSNHVKKERIYQIQQNFMFPDAIRTFSSTPGLLAPALKAEIPGIVNSCRQTENNSSLLFRIGDRSMFAAGCYADSSIFSIFTLPFVQGKAADAFSQLYSIVITEKTAKKFFGEDKKVIGRTVSVDNKQDFVVTGVIKDLPANSSLDFEWISPLEIQSRGNKSFNSWGSNSYSTFVELSSTANPDAINRQLYNYVKDKMHAPDMTTHAFLFAMKDWRLRSQFVGGKQAGGRIEYVHIFSLVALIVLFIACINFMNLATARSEKRAREVGVRKVLGAGKKKLILQFLSEALFMSLLAALVAVLLMSVSLPAFNILVEKTLYLNLLKPSHIGMLLLITLICGLVAGSYPSFYLSSFNPVFVLKGIRVKGGSAPFIRQGLVVLQFTASIVLIIGTIIIYQQLQHVKNRKLGFDKDNLIELDIEGDMGKNFSSIKQDLLSTGLVTNAALSDHVIIYSGNNTGGFTWPGKDPSHKTLISIRMVSPEFMATSDMHIIEGQDFKPGTTADSTNIIITASLAKLMTKESAVGRIIQRPGDANHPTLTFKVIGVVNDYVYGNMYGQPDPVIFFCISQDPAVMYVRTRGGHKPEQILSGIEAVMKRDNPLYPFAYQFVDDQFNQLFLDEMLIGKLSRIFAGLAIVISCLGLFGLAAYTAERRTKEIGIRKVLGASVAGITRLISKDFIRLIILSAIIAFPLSWWMMQKWLQGYAYRVAIGWQVFAIAGLLATFIALVTICFQSIKAALANPTKSLRSE
jgi:putative ABC transport system permease protein